MAEPQRDKLPDGEVEMVVEVDGDLETESVTLLHRVAELQPLVDEDLDGDDETLVLREGLMLTLAEMVAEGEMNLEVVPPRLLGVSVGDPPEGDALGLEDFVTEGEVEALFETLELRDAVGETDGLRLVEEHALTLLVETGVLECVNESVPLLLPLKLTLAVLLRVSECEAESEREVDVVAESHRLTLELGDTLTE